MARPTMVRNGVFGLNGRRLAVLGAIIGAVGVFLVLPDGFYQWAKAFHIIAVISWMAAMLYLPRLFVYHAEAGSGTPQAETFKVMERRLLRAIMTPAMVASWYFGLWMAWKGFAFSGGWLHAKLAAVLVLSGMHGYFAMTVRRFAEDRDDKAPRHWRIMNEMPAVLMVIIVILVVIKPW
jgi:protoporphyrinogen IX oxidase